MVRVLDIKLISATADGEEGNFGSSDAVFSPDGTKIAFVSNANNLGGGSGGIFEKDLSTGVVTRIATGVNPVYLPNGILAYSQIEGNSTVLQNYDGFLNDINSTGEVVWVLPGAADEDGEEEIPTDPVFSLDGTRMAFKSDDGIIVKNMGSGAVIATLDGFDPTISADGTKVAFWSHDDLIPGDTNGNGDVFVKDLVTGELTLASVGADGTQGNHLSSGKPTFSPDGTKVAFHSYASNFVGSDGNSTIDIFVKDLVTGELTMVSVKANGKQGDGSSVTPVFSPDGTQLIFTSDARNLVAGDDNRSSDVFIVTLGDGIMVRGTDDADNLHGGTDSDVVTGFWGKDKLYGEGGSDTFVFETGESGKTRDKADTIYDFTKDDTVDLSGWDADSTAEGTQAFEFIGSRGFSNGQAGELHVVKTKSDTWIEGNTDNDKKAEFVIRLDDALTLKEGNFDGLL